MSCPSLTPASGVLLLLGALFSVPAAQGPVDEGEILFRERVLPIFNENCFKCHGPAAKKAKGGLRISDRAALLAGGESGPALVPGDAKGSLLAVAVGYGDPLLEMPPDGPLSEDDRAALLRWIDLGAPWPEGESMDAEAVEASAPVEKAELHAPDVETGRTWWSFRPVVRPPVPAVQHPELVASPIDAFLLAPLEQRGLLPNGPATRYELARRATFDLHGLPPSYEEVQAFLADDAPGAWERLVDRLLASPRYAEHWGRHWLDLVRFAETNGYERDAEKPFAWRYRDWVLDAFERDLSYDRFLTEQLAGDELPDADRGSLIATGFLRIGVWDDEPAEKETAVFDELDDMVRTVSEGMLGASLACARCHDHKFDPFLQEDYYAMVAYLRNVRPYEEARLEPDSAILRPLEGSGDDDRLRAEERAGKRAVLMREIDALLEQGRERLAQGGRRNAATAPLGDVARALDPKELRRLKELRAAVTALDSDPLKESTGWILCAREAGTEPPPTHVLVRGNASAPADLVGPHPPKVLYPPDAAPPAPEPPASGESSGRRLALARWIASPENPLTARAIVNRVWQFHFGVGLAPTPNDLGHAGMAPTNTELIDWLAATFVEEDGWSLKALHRRIMLSNAYRLSSRASDPACLAADEGDELLWRQRPHRLTAEEVYDASLHASGELCLSPDASGGRGFFPELSSEAMAGSSRPGLGWEVSQAEDRARRAVYAFVKRSQPVPLFEAFDGPGLTLPVGTRGVTTTATQALTLLNGAFTNERAAALAARVAAEAGDGDADRVRRAYERALARPPTAAEAELALAYLARASAAFEVSPRPLSVRFDVPERVDRSFLVGLAGADILLGPRAGWTFLKGRWGNPYNGTLAADELRGPALLRQDLTVADAEVKAGVRVLPGGTLGLILRAGQNAAGELAGGIELRFDRDAGEVRVLSHGAEESQVLARFPAELERDEPLALHLSLAGAALAFELDGVPAGAVGDLPGEASGAFGLSALGDGGQLFDLCVLEPAETPASDDTGAVVRLAPDDPGTPRQRALEALCLSLLNLNEFVYVD